MTKFHGPSTLNAEFVRRALEYNCETGTFTWKIRPRSDFATDRGFAIFRTLYEGKEAFSFIGENGYRQTRIKGVAVLAHRVAFLIVTGSWPVSQVDHINGDRSDNRWANLRLADQSINSRNMAMQSRNTSGRVGVRFDHSRQKWVAQGRADKQQFNLGRFDTMQEATAARAAFEIEHGFHPNHGRIAA